MNTRVNTIMGLCSFLIWGAYMIWVGNQWRAPRCPKGEHPVVFQDWIFCTEDHPLPPPPFCNDLNADRRECEDEI
jgi:hypothetical protein